MDHKKDPVLQFHILQQLWKDVSKGKVIKSPNQAWWKKKGSKKSASCTACMGTEGRCFEQFCFNRQWAEIGNRASEILCLQNIFFSHTVV